MVKVDGEWTGHNRHSIQNNLITITFVLCCGNLKFISLTVDKLSYRSFLGIMHGRVQKVASTMHSHIHQRGSICLYVLFRKFQLSHFHKESSNVIDFILCSPPPNLNIPNLTISDLRTST